MFELQNNQECFVVLVSDSKVKAHQTVPCVLDQTTPDPSYSGGEASGRILPLSRGSQRGLRSR